VIIVQARAETFSYSYLVAEGCAWVYRKYMSDPKLLDNEIDASEAELLPLLYKQL
jgi:hypothetical protein|tara:strand:- start:150 stop:314 length:165 start_codon:yes stop_codon:yes gene_type:complete